MRNENLWVPSKFVLHGGRWRASRDPKQVHRASRLVADRAASAYSAALRKYARGDLIDLGCGQVPLFGAYQSLVETVTCADWPKSFHDSPHIDFEIDLSSDFKLPVDGFDTVLLTDVLEHLPNPTRAFAEFAAALRPNGCLIVGVPFYYWIHEQPFDYFRFTEYRLRLFCEEVGLQVEELRPTGGPRDVMLDTVGKYIAQSRRPWRWLSAFPSRIGTIVKPARLDFTAMPLGYVLVARKPLPML